MHISINYSTKIVSCTGKNQSTRHLHEIYILYKNRYKNIFTDFIFFSIRKVNDLRPKETFTNYSANLVILFIDELQYFCPLLYFPVLLLCVGISKLNFVNTF